VSRISSQRREEPARGNTGLFFFRGKPGAPFAVISPGGGFSYIASVHLTLRVLPADAATLTDRA